MTSQSRITADAQAENPALLFVETVTTKRMIQIELDLMTDPQLDAVFILIEGFMQTQPLREGATFMEKMRRIKIDAPPDFSTKWERYLGEEADTKNVATAIAKETQS